MTPDAAKQKIKAALADPLDVVRRIGLGRRAQRQAGGVLVLCPGHDERTPSCSVTRGPDGTLRVKCFGGCELAGNVFDLIAAVERLDVRRDFRAVLEHAAALAGVSLDDRPAPRAPRPLSPPPPAAPPRDFPPPSEVQALWAAALPVGDDGEASAWVRARGLDVAAVEDFDLARVIPRGAPLPAWARFGGRSWTMTGHRVLVLVFDANGAARGVRAIRIVDGDTPKRLPPAGHRAAGLVLADALGRLVLGGRAREGWPSPLRVVIAEGEPDFLTWASRFSDADESAPAVFGVVAGGWTNEHAARIPDGARVTIWTHPDRAGDAYAAAIARSLAGRCTVLRSRRDA